MLTILFSITGSIYFIGSKAGIIKFVMNDYCDFGIFVVSLSIKKLIGSPISYSFSP